MRLTSLAWIGLVGALSGCAGTVTGVGGDADVSTTTSALVVVERTTDVAQGTHAEGSARFVRVAAQTSPADALRVVGAALDLPASGACETVSSLAGSIAPDGAAPVVELLDVGDVSLRSDRSEMHLWSRRLPDVTDVVTGVVYDRAAEAALLPAASRYLLRVAGGPAVAPFEVSAAAPSDPSTVRVEGEDGRGLLVVRGATVDLTWTAEGGTSGDATGDLVYVDVRPNGVRCAFAGSGASAGGGAPAGPAGSVSTLFFDDAGTMIVHRLHREPMRVPGFDGGEIRFDFARTLAYVRR